jgi:hypothetical protein
MTKKNRMAIISSYFEGETYGLLGPQMASTIIEKNSDFECIVIAVTRDDDKSLIKKILADYFGHQKPVIGFSSLSGREDLFTLAKDLKDEGSITILAGPQANADYIGEVRWNEHPHRFKGVSDCFTLSIKGPAEQAIPLLRNITDKESWCAYPGVNIIINEDQVISNNSKPWDEAFLKSVNWNNLYRIDKVGTTPIKITTGQVLQQIGCPYAAGERWIDVDYPSKLKELNQEKIRVLAKGCSFCDVATDKGFYGELELDTVLSQIACLPALEDGTKIPFELINENPLFRLPRLMNEIKKRNMHLSQINLILRADYFLKGETRLRESLLMAQDTGMRIHISSMGFEAFDDTLLSNFNKGINVETGMKAIRLMRDLKNDYMDVWSYSRTDGAVHGFIHPTPWDSTDTVANTQRNIAIYGLERDILPPHSTPLIIHHSCALADWIREVEDIKGVRYKRHGSIIGWWST